MQNHTDSLKNLSCPNTELPASAVSKNASLWEEYSSFHDSFTEILSYENSRKNRSDIWELYYI